MAKYANLILQLINRSENHMTAEEIFLELKKSEPGVVQATVYNNLNALYRDGMIRKVSVEGFCARYDKMKKHDHLVCKKCGALSDISFEDLTENLERQLDEGIISYDLKVFYLCPKCRREK